MSIFSTRIMQVSLAALGLFIAGSLSAQSVEQRIAERIKPVGEVCVQGDPCSGAEGALQVAQADTQEEFDPESVYQQNCNVCHGSGMANAPRLDDPEAWQNRIDDKGMETVIENAINGINAMPPKGMCMTCTDEQIAQVVEYMVEASQE